MSTKQRRIAEAARKYRGESLKSVAHHIDVEWMYCAYELVRRDGAKGIDGVGAEEYERNLRENLANLVDKLKSGTYRAPAVRRVYIPKAGSTEKRPLGIPTYEDKILQRAVQLVLEPIYEEEFYDFSYGFRPGKSAHQALDRLRNESMNIGGGYIIDMDISKYFDSIPHDKLWEILGQRVSDGVIHRIIGKWLNAGVMEDETIRRSEKGSPQGGVISPLLSNVYLHEVLDEWFDQTVQPRLEGKSFMVRYADDAVIGCEKKEDADRIMKVLALRFEKYGLTIHPEKTRLIDFTKPVGESRKGKGSFTFLGFCHYWTKSRKGRWMVGRKTDSKRLSRALKIITRWCRENRHRAKREQHKELAAKLRGHYAYYGVSLNYAGIGLFYEQVKRVWSKWLNRRSRKTSQDWQQFGEYLRNFPLPRPKIVHLFS
ncbi:MAG: group II intron reverse transcriptase/maturase [Treponema sp.]|jgi:group II intron reverse transcriptase/maturase|nr:group II intron reverse transcriptase/maturase [Treponema sp.]